MNKFIVTTTINPPTEALKKFAAMDDWKLIVVGDLKTPHELYRSMDKVIYLSPEDQEKRYPDISKTIGWKTIQRRNLGFIEAYNLGADIVATVDDDNIPTKDWGKSIFVGKEAIFLEVRNHQGWVDPIWEVFQGYSIWERLWHRGFPIQRLSERKTSSKSTLISITPKVQANFWNGDPDIDAIQRITLSPSVVTPKFKPFTTRCLSPFNSQNTFVSRDVLQYYMCLPFIGRMDDIWGAYVLEQIMDVKNNPFVVYDNATVYQDRNIHDYVKDLEAEMMGYNSSVEFETKSYTEILPTETLKAFELYNSYFK